MSEEFPKEKAKVDALVKNFPGGAFMAGLDGSVLFANETAACLVGLPEVKSLIDAARADPQRSPRTLVEVPREKGESAFYDCRAFRWPARGSRTASSCS